MTEYDQGGYPQPALSEVRNNTGRPIPVRTANQEPPVQSDPVYDDEWPDISPHDDDLPAPPDHDEPTPEVE